MTKGDAYFERWKNRRLQEREFQTAYDQAGREIEQVDAVIQALEERRIASHLSKAELARAIGKRPELIRRIFTADHCNPTLQTIASIADVLDVDLTLQPRRRVTTVTRRAARRAKAVG